MKKRITVLMIFVFVIIFAAGCGKSKNTMFKDFSDAISELRTDCFYGDNGNMSVKIITGKREEPYLVDGVKKPLTEFTVITVKPAEDIDTQYTYSISSETQSLAGQLDPHPFGGQYIADAGKQLKNAPITVTVTNANGREEVLELAPLFTAEMINYETAVRSFIQAKKSDIESMYEGDILKAEAYVRFLLDPVNETDTYYWYVAMSNGESTFAALIDVISGEVVVEN